MPLFQNLRRRFSASPVMQDWPGLIEAYRAWLPVTDSTPVITLREGATPLIPVPSVAERIGKGVKVFVKDRSGVVLCLCLLSPPPFGTP